MIGGGHKCVHYCPKVWGQISNLLKRHLFVMDRHKRCLFLYSHVVFVELTNILRVSLTGCDIRLAQWWGSVSMCHAADRYRDEQRWGEERRADSSRWRYRASWQSGVKGQRFRSQELTSEFTWKFLVLMFNKRNITEGLTTAWRPWAIQSFTHLDNNYHK